jgi:hypothetical protein
MKARIAQEDDFALSRLSQIHLIKDRIGDGYARITDEGRTVTEERLAVLSEEYSKKEQELRKAKK